jgi:hypothetical protein
VHSASLTALAVVVALVVGCRGAETYAVDEVRRAFSAEGIRLDPPDFGERGQVMHGSRLRATLSDAGGMGEIEVLVFDDADAYDRVREPLRDVGAGDVLGKNNVVVVGPVRGSAPRVDAALRRLR